MVFHDTGNSELFESLVRPFLEKGLRVLFQARGGSMSPAIRHGDIVEITPVRLSDLRKNDIVLAKTDSGFRLHRLVKLDQAKNICITRGDCAQEDDPPLIGKQILGRARAKELRLGWTTVRASFRYGWLLRSAARAQYLVEKVLRKAYSGQFDSPRNSSTLSVDPK